jgi:hypothetical protein
MVPLMFVKICDVASSLSMTVMTLLFFLLTNKITVKAKADDPARLSKALSQ